MNANFITFNVLAILATYCVFLEGCSRSTAPVGNNVGGENPLENQSSNWTRTLAVRRFAYEPSSVLQEKFEWRLRWIRGPLDGTVMESGENELVAYGDEGEHFIGRWGRWEIIYSNRVLLPTATPSKVYVVCRDTELSRDVLLLLTSEEFIPGSKAIDIVRQELDHIARSGEVESRSGTVFNDEGGIAARELKEFTKGATFPAQR